MEHLKEIIIKGLWGTTRNIRWTNIHRDVNILVGINGSGKTSLLNILLGMARCDSKAIKKYKLTAAEIRSEQGDVVRSYAQNTIKGDVPVLVEFISTFDVLPKRNKKSESPLTSELLNIIYTTGSQEVSSFFDYRLKATNFPEQAGQINKRIQALYKLINKQFRLTQKEISIDVHTNKVVFKQGENIVPLDALSSGEKQFLLIIFKVFLMEEQPCLLLMDEPEMSLDIDWQFDLINIIRILNPNCQVIVSTHSPGIFGDGWGEKVVYMEDIQEL